MKKNKKINNYSIGGYIKNLFANSFGENKNELLLNGIGSISDIGGGLIPSSGNAKTDAIVNGVSSGLETVGSVFGPVGSAIGKAAGFLTKGVGAIIGSKGSVNTDTGEMTKGRGILGRRNKTKLKNQWRRVNQGIGDLEQTALLQEQYMNDYGDNDYSLAANGGVLNTTLAYLDDGELFRTPDGRISEIPEEGKPTDSNLVNVPVGTQVLSDKLKVPGTNKTFALKGKEIMKVGKYKGSGLYAENSKKLNDLNAQTAYDELIALLESVKNKKQFKRKNKVNSYVDGTDEIIKNEKWNNNFGGKYKSIAGTMYADKNGGYGEFANQITNWLKDDNNLNTAWKDLGSLPQVKRAMGKYNNDKRMALQANYSDNKYGEVHDWFSQTLDAQNLNKPLPIRKFEKINSTIPSFAKAMPNFGKIPGMQTYGGVKPNTNDNSYNVSNLFGELSGLVGPISSIASATPEKAKVFTYTPQFSPTDYDISSILNEIDLSNAITRYNVNLAGGAGTGANLALAVQGQIARDRAISQAYNQKYNIENERKARNTGIYNDWARYNTEAYHRGYVEDAQNRAAADNIRRVGIRDLGTALQTMAKDRRLNRRDLAVLQAMKPYLEYGMKKKQLNNIYNNLGLWQ